MFGVFLKILHTRKTTYHVTKPTSKTTQIISKDISHCFTNILNNLFADQKADNHTNNINEVSMH